MKTTTSVTTSVTASLTARMLGWLSCRPGRAPWGQSLQAVARLRRHRAPGLRQLALRLAGCVSSSAVRLGTASLPAIVERMKVDARALGTDALVLEGGGLQTSGSGEDCASLDRSVDATAIRWQ